MKEEGALRKKELDRRQRRKKEHKGKRDEGEEKKEDKENERVKMRKRKKCGDVEKTWRCGEKAFFYPNRKAVSQCKAGKENAPSFFSTVHQFCQSSGADPKHQPVRPFWPESVLRTCPNAFENPDYLYWNHQIGRAHV